MVTKSTIIDLIRHGEPVGGKRYRGQIDDPLSEKGWAQMRKAVAGHRPWSVIVSSPLARCAAFAEELSLQLAVPLQQDDRLKEVAFGEWEGKTNAEINVDGIDLVTRFLMDPVGNRPAGAEALDTFKLRIASAWQELLVRNAGEHVLLVSHAGVMRAILAEVLFIPIEHIYKIDVPNAGITRIRVDEYEGKLFSRLIFHSGKL